jgi:hypothetical protein
MRHFHLAVAATLMAALTAAPIAGAASWHVQPAPNPVGSSASELTAVSCPSATRCTAVGDWQGGATARLAEGWNGTTWGVQTTPNPAGAQSDLLRTVACPSASACIAIGTFTPNGSRISSPLAERWNGARWTVAPEPPAPSGGLDVSLADVSCSSATRCMAVGSYYKPSTSSETPLAEAWDGASWTAEPMPAPSGARAAMVAVSCPSATSCVAVGGEPQGGSLTQVLLSEIWDGSTWRLQNVSSPPRVSSALVGLSCASATACMAVGYSQRTSVGFLPLAEQWDGTSWNIVSTPSNWRSPAFSGVSCTLASSCMAVGNALDGAGVNLSFAESWNGTAWSAPARIARPAGSDYTLVSGIACTSSTACTVVGSYKDSDFFQRTLAETYS